MLKHFDIDPSSRHDRVVVISSTKRTFVKDANLIMQHVWLGKYMRNKWRDIKSLQAADST